MKLGPELLELSVVDEQVAGMFSTVRLLDEKRLDAGFLIQHQEAPHRCRETLRVDIVIREIDHDEIRVKTLVVALVLREQLTRLKTRYGHVERFDGIVVRERVSQMMVNSREEGLVKVACASAYGLRRSDEHDAIGRTSCARDF